jgi:hypothetical protein
MKKVIFIGLSMLAIIGCEKNSDNNSNQFIAEIVGYDLNCSKCILSFLEDSSVIKNLLGESQNNYYQTVNLEKDEFIIGQFIKVKVRKAQDNEFLSCINLYPSYNYNNIYVSEYKQFRDFCFNDTIDLGYGDCLNDYEMNNTICFDSVITDSRCPENVVCVWAGEAIARFKIYIDQSSPITLDLYTGTIDTTINEYKLSFIDLLPYPNTEIERRFEDYKAKIIIKQK